MGDDLVPYQVVELVLVGENKHIARDPPSIEYRFFKLTEISESLFKTIFRKLLTLAHGCSNYFFIVAHDVEKVCESKNHEMTTVTPVDSFRWRGVYASNHLEVFPIIE